MFSPDLCHFWVLIFLKLHFSQLKICFITGDIGHAFLNFVVICITFVKTCSALLDPGALGSVVESSTQGQVAPVFVVTGTVLAFCV